MGNVVTLRPEANSDTAASTPPDSTLVITLKAGELRELIRDELRAANNGNGKEDRLVDAEEAARLLSMSRDWLYRHAKQLPFTKKLHHRKVRFSYQGIQKYIAAKRKNS